MYWLMFFSCWHSSVHMGRHRYLVTRGTRNSRRSFHLLLVTVSTWLLGCQATPKVCEGPEIVFSSCDCDGLFFVFFFLTATAAMRIWDKRGKLFQFSLKPWRFAPYCRTSTPSSFPASSFPQPTPPHPFYNKN